MSMKARSKRLRRFELGGTRADAASYLHEGHELLFLLPGLPWRSLRGIPRSTWEEIRDWIVCPTCLAEKPKSDDCLDLARGATGALLPLLVLR